MASIQEHLDKIKNAVFGKDVRQSIHDGLHEINQETESTSKKQEKLERTFNDLIINAGNSNAEVAAARNGFETLGKRLDGVDSQLDTITNVLDLLIVNDGVTDNTTIIQTALDRSNHVRISKKGTYVVRRLTIHDNTTFELADGVILKQKDNNSDYIIVNDKWRATDGSYNTNIKIIGGKYDINASNNPRTGAIIDGLYAGIGIVLNNVRNLEVRNIKEIGNALKYCFLFANIENGIFENINCINQSDGLHFQAPCKNIKISNITGTCHDNLLPFTIGDYPAIVISEDGDFDNINIKNVYSKGETTDIIRLVGDGKNGTGTFRNFTIDNVQASCPNTGVIELYDKDQATPNAYLNKTVVENIKISNVKNNSQIKRTIVNIWGEVKAIDIENLYSPYSTQPSSVCSIFSTANVSNINIKDCFIRTSNSGSSFILLEQVKSVSNINIDNCQLESGGTFIKNSTITENTIKVRNCMISCNRIFIVNGKLKLFLDNTKINYVNQSTISDESLLSLLGENNDISFNGGKRLSVSFGTTNSQIRCNSKTIIITADYSNLALTEGDYINLSNDLSSNRKKGLYQYRNNKLIFIDGELTLYVQALDFGIIPANSSVVKEVDISEFGSSISHDYKYGVSVNAYNGTGENNNITYCSWLKDDKVKIRVSNLSNAQVSIVCDWLIKIIK